MESLLSALTGALGPIAGIFALAVVVIWRALASERKKNDSRERELVDLVRQDTQFKERLIARLEDFLRNRRS